MKAWIGEELEGRLIGIKTLFIGSPFVSYKDIKNILKDDLELCGIDGISQIYFGAGMCTRLNEDVIKKCLRGAIGSMYTITAEVDINRLHKYNIKMLQKLNLIITINNKNAKIFQILNPPGMVLCGNQIKIQNLDMMCVFF